MTGGPLRELERLLPLLSAEARLDPELTWSELIGLLTALLEHELNETTGERVLGFLECNLPGARVRELIEWPGQWFGNRWLEEVVLGPEEVALYALARSGRELPGVPFDPELPFPLPKGEGD